mmetsp:Transcript_12959/g.42731  ORF Transcript_12959/g.42731 Transcript_12959/m.42731 type:complete len:241 (+) Transcript_12959:193-915(+)
MPETASRTHRGHVEESFNARFRHSVVSTAMASKKVLSRALRASSSASSSARAASSSARAAIRRRSLAWAAAYSDSGVESPIICSHGCGSDLACSCANASSRRSKRVRRMSCALSAATSSFRQASGVVRRVETSEGSPSRSPISASGTPPAGRSSSGTKSAGSEPSSAQYQLRCARVRIGCRRLSSGSREEETRLSSSRSAPQPSSQGTRSSTSSASQGGRPSIPASSPRCRCTYWQTTLR